MNLTFVMKTIRGRGSVFPSLLLLLRTLMVVVFVVVVVVIMVSSDVTRGREGDRQDQSAMSLNSEVQIRMRGPFEASDPRVLAMLRSTYLTPPSTLPYNLTLHKNFHSYITSHTLSWNFYHHYVQYFFENQQGGFFVEAGALDGEYLSNTLWLETTLGWSGLLIEADNNNYRHLAWKRRRAWTSNTCVSKEEYPREAVFEVLVKSSHYLTWLYHANTREINTHVSILNDEMSNSSERAYTKAQCFPLTSYLLALNVTLIDFLSLDIQGHEWAVLRSLPLDHLRVRSLAVEHLAAPNTTRGGWSFDNAFVRYMEEVGYHLVDVYKEIDYFFVLRSDETLRRLSDPGNVIKYIDVKLRL